MITIFNRRELTITFSMEEQARIRSLLSENGIDYGMNTVNRQNSSPFSAGRRARTGSFGENPDLAYEYIFHVKKEDFDAAVHVIR